MLLKFGLRVRNHVDAKSLVIILHESLLEIVLRIPVRFDFDRLLAAASVDFDIGLNSQMIVCTYSIVARANDTGQGFTHLADMQTILCLGLQHLLP